MNNLFDVILDKCLDLMMVCIAVGLPVLWVLAAIRIYCNLAHGLPWDY